MKIKTPILAVIILVVLFGSIGLSSLLGYWNTNGSRTLQVFNSRNSSVQNNPSDIRGSQSFGEIARDFNIPEKDLVDAFGLKTDLDSIKCKDLATIVSSVSDKEVGVGSVRYFVALYKGIAYTGEPSYLPQAAADIIKSKAALSGHQLSVLEKYTI